MRVPYHRPTLPDPRLIAADVERIVASGTLTKGPTVHAYEKALRDRLGVDHVVATSSGTVALALLYAALDVRGMVIMPSFTFMATATALSWAGGTPNFADVDRSTWTLDPTSVADRLNAETTAIVAVPVFGVPCDIDALQALADDAGVPLLFDSAHGLGSAYRDTPLGSFGTAEVFSTTPTKALVTGEGGFVATDDGDLADRIRVLIEYGNDGRYEVVRPGLNGRMQEVPAAIGLRMLDIVDRLLSERRELAQAYRRELESLEGVAFQSVPADCQSSYKDFTILLQDGWPDAGIVAKELENWGVETRRYFHPALHRHTYYAPTHHGKLEVTESIESRVLSLPIWPGLSEAELNQVVRALRETREQYE